MPNQKAGRVKNAPNVRSDGANRVMELVRALNRSYEGTLTAANSPLDIEFFGDQGWNSIQGWLINDGLGNLRWQFSRDGITFGDLSTMLPAENANLKGLDIHTLRLAHTGTDADYRVFLI